MDQSIFREESDSMGKVRVPINALYGAQTQRAVENFKISGLKPMPMFIVSMAHIKGAAAKVNAQLGLLDPEIANAIQEAADEVVSGEWWDQFVVDPYQAGAGTSHNMNVNEVLASLASKKCGKKVNPNDHVNMSQSTNDVIPTAIRLGCLLRLKELTDTLCCLTDELKKKANEFDGIVKSGRTHLQDAVPIRLGQEFSGYAEAVRKDTRRIIRSAENLKELGIGGTAVGTGLNAHPLYHNKMIKALSMKTGLELQTSNNLVERMQSMADMADFSSAMRVTALTLIRIANDFRLLSSGPSTGLNEIHLPALQPGSSIMPGKVNPVMAEMLDMAMFRVVGADTSVAMAVQSGQLELNVMMPLIANELFESMQILIGSVKAFTEKCVEGIIANKDQAEHWLDRNAIIVTALNPIIGYQSGAQLVKKAIAENRLIREIAVEAAEQGKLKHIHDGSVVMKEEITDAFSDLRKMTGG